MVTKNRSFLISFVLVVGIGFSFPGMTAMNCSDDIGTAFNGNVGTFCMSKIQMNWFTAFSWCKAIGGHFPTLVEACDGKLRDCKNLSGKLNTTERVWTATPYGKNVAYQIRLSDGAVYLEPNNNVFLRNSFNYVLCAE